MPAKDIMKQDVLTVNPEMSVKELAAFFLRHHISGAPVIQEGKLVGLVTEEDVIFQDKQVHLPTMVAIFDAVIYLDSVKNFEQEMGKILGEKVADIMKREVTTVSEDTAISEIATIMTKKQVYLVPVTRGKQVVGIISKAEMIEAITKGLD